jgi:hypothetical protein
MLILLANQHNSLANVVTTFFAPQEANDHHIETVFVAALPRFLFLHIQRGSPMANQLQKGCNRLAFVLVVDMSEYDSRNARHHPYPHRIHWTPSWDMSVPTLTERIPSRSVASGAV